MSPNSFQLQEVRALDLLVYILNFYRSCLTAPVLREAIRVTYGSKSEREISADGCKSKRVQRLREVICHLMAEVQDMRNRQDTRDRQDMRDRQDIERPRGRVAPA